MSNVQSKKPTRTCKKKYSDYRSFKPYLIEDFNHRCGYCDDDDFYSGGKRNYHIDHFKPHSIKKFNHLKEIYSNLIYSCPYCNCSKSNKWKDVNGFIDPCEAEYDNHVKRNGKGQIHGITDQGKYIFENLNLGLIRHELLWCIDKLQEQKKRINQKRQQFKDKNGVLLEVLQAFAEIQDKIDKYTELFKEQI